MSVTAILLSAGYATRLYPITKDRPKALLPLGDGVILDEVLRSLDGITALKKRILVTNHRFAGQFRTWREAREISLEIVDDKTETNETRLGAIRDLELARVHGGAVGDLLVLGTDNLFSWSLAEFVQKAQRYRPEACVAVGTAHSLEAARQYGVVTCDTTSRITAFIEKSPTPPSLQVAHCVYYFPEAICGAFQQFLDSGGNPDAPGYLVEWLVRTRTVYGVPMLGSWYDIGTRESYESAVHEWDRKRKISRNYDAR